MSESPGRCHLTRVSVRGPHGGNPWVGTVPPMIWTVVPAVAVLLALVAVMPLWPHSRGWGWAPAGMVGITLATIVLFTLSVEL